MRTAAPGPTGELADRCAIITGASRGLGLAIAERAVHVHRGAIHATNAPQGGGLIVEIVLPLS